MNNKELLKKIKFEYIYENLVVPTNLKERLKNFPVCLDDNMKPIFNESPREMFLIFVTNDLLNKKNHITFDTNNNVMTSLNDLDRETYLRLNEELRNIWRNKQ